MDEYELDSYLNEFFVRFVLENYPEIAQRWRAWTGFQCHEIPMAPNHTCEWYRKRLGLDDNTNAGDARESH